MKSGKSELILRISEFELFFRNKIFDAQLTGQFCGGEYIKFVHKLEGKPPKIENLIFYLILLAIINISF